MSLGLRVGLRCPDGRKGRWEVDVGYVGRVVIVGRLIVLRWCRSHWAGDDVAAAAGSSATVSAG